MTLMKMMVISLPVLALIVPAALVRLALVVGFACEGIAYFPLRLLPRREDKVANSPHINHVLTAG